MSQHLKTLVLIFKRFGLSPLSCIYLLFGKMHLEANILGIRKEREWDQNGGCPDGAPGPAPSLEQWGCQARVLDSCCLPRAPAEGRPVLPGGSDVLTSKD